MFALAEYTQQNLLLALNAGIGTGVLISFRRVGSLSGIVPAIQRRLTLVTLFCYLLFTLVTVWTMIFSALKLVL